MTAVNVILNSVIYISMCTQRLGDNLRAPSSSPAAVVKEALWEHRDAHPLVYSLQLPLCYSSRVHHCYGDCLVLRA